MGPNGSEPFLTSSYGSGSAVIPFFAMNTIGPPRSLFSTLKFNCDACCIKILQLNIKSILHLAV